MANEDRDRKVIREAYADGIRPEPQTTVSAWADSHRRLPTKTSAEPGPWRTSRTPYLREIMDELSTSSSTEEVVVMAAAQLGKSEAILNGLGYLIDCAPSPAMLVQPTVDLAKRFSRQRVDPLMSTPRLRDKVSKAAAAELSRDAANSMVQKEFMGGVLVMTGANSAAGLRSMPVRWLMLDEIDAYPVDVDGEGSPMALAEARQRTFARRKRIKTSTPTIAGRSAIESAFDASDRRRYHVPCPHCGTMQTLIFARLTWTALGLEPADAVYQCGPCECEACKADDERAEGCGLYIEERHKTDMLARGVWRAGNPASPIRGYHLNALYSPLGWMRWGEIAQGFLDSRKDPLKLRVWTNTVLGEPFAEKGEAPEWQRLYDRRAGYALSTVPAGGLFLTAGVDVQKDRLVYEVVAWGRGKRSWSVDFGEIPGNSDDLDGASSPWRRLDGLLARGFEHELGPTLSILMLAVDSGFNTQHVYTWARTHSMGRVIAIKGQDHGALIGAPSPVDITLRGTRPIRGYKVWPVCGAVAKRELYGFIRLEAPIDAGSPAGPVEPPAGWCEWPEYGPDYFKQLTAEQLVTVKNRRGFIVQTWEVIPGRQNHALDARVYARAAAALVGLDRFRESDWAGLERPLAPRPGTGDNPPKPASPAPAKRPRSGFLGGRRGGWFDKR
jgi:phage terminase large subunit GpA-like protein